MQSRRNPLHTLAALALLGATACTDAKPGRPGAADPSLVPASAFAPPAAARRDSVKAKPKAPPGPPGLRLVVNVPAGRLDLIRGDSALKSYPVSVGTSAHPTPVGTFWISTVIWNPSWHPPESAWARKRKPEPPGPRNPMGRVKLHISELYYIHGTTSVGRLGGPASHGCIRMANADIIDLTRRLHADRTPDFGRARIDSLVENSKWTRSVALDRPVRLDVVYRLAELRKEQVQLHPDVYRRSSGGVLREARELLRGKGRPEDQVEHQALTEAYQEWTRKGKARVQLAALEALYEPPQPAQPDSAAQPRLPGVEVGARADTAVAVGNDAAAPTPPGPVSSADPRPAAPVVVP